MRIRMTQTMAKLQKMRGEEYSSFLRVMFGLDSPSPIPENLDNAEDEIGKIDWVDENLNDSQKKAIKFALASREVALIHGPPGVSDKGFTRSLLLTTLS
jgi:DNA polymerase alpha-associated DNA helicase A